ncbi:hypothetical protein NEDG_00562 [Nematocida displodere]|uniref:Uncharacterized protein n=1 Tax=Nematocida displodere TaxID=1805483 RepID=A0A177EEK8_9MICR|nr:hypothetical protein NEDG_00562 [Nematocida displodere]
MSQWSRRSKQRTISLPIFFNSISDEDRSTSIRDALDLFVRGTKAIPRILNLSCLTIKDLPAPRIVSAIQKVETADFSSRIEETKYWQETSEFVLNLEGNLLGTIPDEIFEAPSIVGILLRSNRLATLPSRISSLFRLRTLTLANNPIEYLPVEVRGLKLSNFTITGTCFLSAEEMAARNAAIAFTSRGLEELCLRSLDSSPDSPRMLPGYERCSICKKQSHNYQIFFKSLPFRGTEMPFAITLCSSACLEDCLRSEL